MPFMASGRLKQIAENLGVMASKSDKGKEVEIVNEGLQRLQEGTKGSSSSTAKGTPARRFEAKAVEPHGLKWFQAQKVCELGLGYVFAKLEDCNLTLVGNFIQTETLPSERAPSTYVV
ncbi:hypothetical protein HAX54_038614, partial [Datura stramonium]|nr:hypothetical protein [Datura stramonium]